MTDIAEELLELADELDMNGATDDGDGLPEVQGYQMAEMVYRTHPGTEGKPLVVYRDVENDAWVKCGDNWVSVCAQGDRLADAVTEANQ